MAKDVVSDLAETEKPDAPAQQDRAKRRQIMDGAREVFLAQGFDAASMGEIARKAGFSKGTLYVYFDSKEQLFEAIAHEACGAQAEGVFSLDPADHDVEAVLTRLGRSFVKFLCRLGAIAAHGHQHLGAHAGDWPEVLRNGSCRGGGEGSPLSRESSRGRKPDDRGLRGRGGPIPGFLSCHDFETAPFQCRRCTCRRAYQPRGRHCGPHVPGGLPARRLTLSDGRGFVFAQR